MEEVVLGEVLEVEEAKKDAYKAHEEMLDWRIVKEKKDIRLEALAVQHGGARIFWRFRAKRRQ